MNKKTLIMAVGGVVLIGGAAGGAFFLGKGSAPEPEMAAAQAEPEPPKETIYHTITPEFVVNFIQPSETQFLMVDVTVASKDSVVIEALEKHEPQVRNELLLLFSEHANESLFTNEGKASIRELATEKVKEIVTAHLPDGEIEDLFFTRLVMQ